MATPGAGDGAPSASPPFEEISPEELEEMEAERERAAERRRAAAAAEDNDTTDAPASETASDAPANADESGQDSQEEAEAGAPAVAEEATSADDDKMEHEEDDDMFSLLDSLDVSVLSDDTNVHCAVSFHRKSPFTHNDSIVSAGFSSQEDIIFNENDREAEEKGDGRSV